MVKVSGVKFCHSTVRSAQQEFLCVGAHNVGILKWYLGQVNDAVFWTYQHTPSEVIWPIGKLLTGVLLANLSAKKDTCRLPCKRQYLIGSWNRVDDAGHLTQYWSPQVNRPMPMPIVVGAGNSVLSQRGSGLWTLADVKTRIESFFNRIILFTVIKSFGSSAPLFPIHQYWQ